jgi:hypothetical protein
MGKKNYHFEEADNMEIKLHGAIAPPTRHLLKERLISGAPNYPTGRIRKIMFQSVPGWRLITAIYTRKMENGSRICCYSACVGREYHHPRKYNLAQVSPIGQARYIFCAAVAPLYGNTSVFSRLRMPNRIITTSLMEVESESVRLNDGKGI